MIPLLTAEQMRRMDGHTIHQVGVPGAVLMETAGRGVFTALWSRFGDLVRRGPVAVVCGKGNNGGDGFVVARCLHNRGVRVTAHLLGTREAVDSGGDAGVHLEAYLRGGGQLLEISATDGAWGEELARAALVVDAVLGTGLAQDLRGLAAGAVERINQSSAPVVSVDIPSGVSSDDGRVCGQAVRADLTVTFAFPKRGHYLYPGAARVGELQVVDIGIPGDILEVEAPDLFLFQGQDWAGFPPRPADAHKGAFGHVAVIGGSPGKAGAPGLAAWGALRSGAGLATVAWPRGVGGENRLPLEVMTQPLSGGGPGADQWCAGSWEDAADLVSTADAVVVGPGMGTSAGAGEVVGRLLGTTGTPVIVDADGLNLLAADPQLVGAADRDLILTPHPGEAGRLLGANASRVQADRIGAVEELAGGCRATVVLKGAGTLVAAPGEATCLVPVGNPGMATAGTGDVLAGIIAALVARGLRPVEAARAGVLLHGSAGDRACARMGEEALVASDLIDALPEVLRRHSTTRPGQDTESKEMP